MTAVNSPRAGTGRLSRGLGGRAHRVVFGANADAAIDLELPHITVVDEAHLVMLAERRLLDAGAAARLLTEIHRLRAAGFAPLRGRPAPRGVYLLYEDHLIEALGMRVGGVLHTGRSRNDLKATTHHLRLRDLAIAALGALLRLQALLLSRARRFRTVVMPVYSQFQPATPGSYGHYLLGVGESLDRDVLGLRQACAGLAQCPLGAASGGGTDVAIDPARTAALLGFTVPVGHAGYAVASRDTAVRLLSACVLAGLTLSRLATDLQLWSTPEFGLVGFPDSLVGSSSAMPQKRNPFLLEHIKGGAGALIGAWTAAVANTKNVPFGNSVEVTTEAVASVWPAIDRFTELTELAISVAAGARPCQDAMLRGADEGFTVATAVANRLMAQGVPFRAAHRVVGSLVTELITEGVRAPSEVDIDATGERLGVLLRSAEVSTRVELTGADLDPVAVLAATDFGGGPGPRSFAAAHDRLAAAWRDHARAVAAWSDRLAAAETERNDAVRRWGGAP
ncbi:lyase family protein [Actinophytocola sp.]|uniref:lyase family protein n=1 Tax=Actinophytocola sp. TaxID=1872138 RepID=UPI003899F25D